MSDVVLTEGEEGSGTELAKIDAGSLAILNKSEIEQQVDTAKKYPRSVKRFRDEAMTMATLTESIAEGCIYAVPRGGKTIEGPSARFAEIIISAWGNSRAGARIISEDNETITAQGFFFDVERNVTIALEIKRRITDKHGRRYNTDMISTTGNAAASIAFRNAVLKGIPKAFWADMYDAARKTAIGTVETLVNKRSKMIEYFQKMGITQEAICATLEIAGIEDIGMDELAVLKGMATALREGESTPEQLFKMPEKVVTGKGTAGLKDKIKEKDKTPEKEKTVGQTLHDEAQGLLKKVTQAAAEPEKKVEPEKKPEPEKTAKKEPPAEKKAAEVAPGSTEGTPADVGTGVVSAIAAILRGADNPTELDMAWKREVENGTLAAIDKKKLAFIYQEMSVKLHNKK